MSAFPERYQDQWWTWPDNWSASVGPRRSHEKEPAFVEWNPWYRRWTQAGQVLKNHKPAKFFTRPHDGKRAGCLGRFKDALTGEGADVFVTISGEKRTRMRDRPQRWQWTGWGLSPDEMWNRARYDKDFRAQDLMPIWERDGTRAARRAKPRYDFNRREFLSQGQIDRAPWAVLRNAQWREGAARNDAFYWTAEDANGMPSSNVPWSSQWFPGGRPRWGV